jgi:hypothetical protein
LLLMDQKAMKMESAFQTGPQISVDVAYIAQN